MPEVPRLQPHSSSGGALSLQPLRSITAMRTPLRLNAVQQLKELVEWLRDIHKPDLTAALTLYPLWVLNSTKPVSAIP